MSTGAQRRHATRRFTRRVLVTVLVALVLEACGGLAASTPLANTRRTEEALVEAVLEASFAKDQVALQGFLVSRVEYETLLWPELPDREHTPFDFVWSLNAANSRKGLAQLLGSYGGMQLELVSINFTEEVEVYDGFRLHPGVEVTVRRAGTGEEGVLPSLDVFVEHGSGWKLVNYDEL